MSGTDETIREALGYKRIAVVGISRDPDKPARRVPKFLMSKGYEIIPVNPFVGGTMLGRRAYPSLAEVAEPVDVVEVFRPSADVPPIVDQAIARGDVRVIWLQEGITHPAAEEKARRHGIKVVADRCMYKEWVRLNQGRESERL